MFEQPDPEPTPPEPVPGDPPEPDDDDQPEAPEPGEAMSDERTPDVIDGARFLGLSQKDGMRELGLNNEKDYARAYRDVEAAVYARDNRESQGGVHAPVVVKRAGVKVTDA